MEGRRHDSALLRESSVLRRMSNHITTADGRIFSVYVDPAYPLSDGQILVATPDDFFTYQYQGKTNKNGKISLQAFQNSLVC
jgi:hypothetical protein